MCNGRNLFLLNKYAAEVKEESALGYDYGCFSSRTRSGCHQACGSIKGQG
ncbi:protein of unknown function [Shewanella benthica]|uniref:Uncharacterized protein n=1 Tax=Shewanella benthica TaxID=43661 RepID=A0A330MAK5_9GAMM|nr:protein of unknown function [Shewanella benthica]